MDKTIKLNNFLYKKNYIEGWEYEANNDVIEIYKKSKTSDDPKRVRDMKRKNYNGVVQSLNESLEKYKEDKKNIKEEIDKLRNELNETMKNYNIPKTAQRELKKDLDKSKTTYTKTMIKILIDDINFIKDNFIYENKIKGYKSHIAKLINWYSNFFINESIKVYKPASEYLRDEAHKYLQKLNDKSEYIELDIVIYTIVTFSEDEELLKKIRVAKHRRDIPYRGINNGYDQYYYLNDADIIGSICYLSIATYWGSQHVPKWEVIDVKFNETNNHADAELYGMEKVNPTKLTEKISGITLNNTNEGCNCVQKYMKEIYKDRYIDQIDKLPIGKNGITIKTIYEFCERNNLIMTAYNRHLKIICEYNPPKPTHQKRLMFVAYNNHCYPIDQKQKLKKKLETPGEHTFKDIIELSDVHKKFIEMLDEGELISEKTIIYDIPLKSKNIKIIQFVHKKVLYTQTSKTKECVNVLKHLGIKYDITPKINDNILFDVIMKEHEGINSVRSFFPFVDIFRKYPCLYQSECEREKGREIITLDFSKFYGNILREIKYLPVIDLMTANVEDCDIRGEHAKFDFKKYYLAYSIGNDKNDCLSFLNPLVPPGVGFYSGVFLSECQKRGVYVHAYKSIDCTYTNNIFSKTIKTLYDAVDNGILNNDVVKIAINRYIGRMYKGLEKTTHEVIESIGTIQQCSYEEGRFIQKLNDEYAITINHTEDVKMHNMMPIYCEIIDRSRLHMYDLIEKLGLMPNDILKINTDSITFYKTYNLFKLDDFIKPNKCYGMKDESHKFKPFENPINMIGVYTKCVDIREHYEQIEIKKDYFKSCYTHGWGETRQLYNCPAGAGKSYSINNDLIPKLNNDYIVLTPTHETRREYTKNNRVNAVIQKYTMSGKIPTEKNIIIDEVGLMNREMNLLIFKLCVLGRNIFSFGDYKQLYPVGCDTSMNKEHYINMLYKEVYDIKINNRNTFKQEYYDKLCGLEELTEIKKELRKYSTEKYYNADVIICNTNKACDIYNELVLNKLNKSPYDVGVLYQCKTNTLCEQDIYNKHVFNVVKNNEKDKTCTLSDGDGRDITLTYDKLNKYFSLGYARTCYGVQGTGIHKIYYFNPNDIKGHTKADEKNNLSSDAVYNLICLQEDKYLTGRFAYTTISRIKNKNDNFHKFPIYYTPQKNKNIVKKNDYIGI